MVIEIGWFRKFDTFTRILYLERFRGCSKTKNYFSTNRNPIQMGTIMILPRNVQAHNAVIQTSSRAVEVRCAFTWLITGCLPCAVVYYGTGMRAVMLSANRNGTIETAPPVVQ